MSPLARFGVSIEKKLLDQFDAIIREKHYPTRSKAIEDHIRQIIAENEFSKDTTDAIGTIDIVYDHHKWELLNHLTNIQHDFQEVILSSQHIHLDHYNCFEIIIVKGDNKKLEKLANMIKATKGVKHSSLQLIAAPAKV
jgi:CopG family nickel-responsive transcriptional regulator